MSKRKHSKQKVYKMAKGSSAKMQHSGVLNVSRKNIVLTLLFAVMMLSLNVYGNDEHTAPGAPALTWQDNIKTAFGLAQKEQKMVMVMVEDVRCKWCIKMKKGALSDLEVQKILQNYIVVKIQRSDNESMESLPGLRGPIPSFHFFTVNKKPIDTIAGYYETEDFLSYIKEIAEESF